MNVRGSDFEKEEKAKMDEAIEAKRKKDNMDFARHLDSMEGVKKRIIRDAAKAGCLSGKIRNEKMTEDVN